MATDHKPFSWDKAHFLGVISGGKNPVVTDPKLLEALSKIDRKDFLPSDYLGEPYADSDDLISETVSIESPVFIAKTLSELGIDPEKSLKILEIGAGTGYLTALFSYIAGPESRIYSLERDLSNAQFARTNLLKYPDLRNYEVIFTDGEAGLVARAPFDIIYAGVAYKTIPDALIAQLAVGGKMIIPLNNMEVHLITKLSESEINDRLLTAKEFANISYGVE